MKRVYNTPSSRFIDLETEGMIAGSATFTVDSSKTTEDRFTQKEDMWGNEDIWH